MPRRKLTELSVTRLTPPPSGRLEVWDSTLPGFGMRISAGGVKSWVLMYRLHGHLRRRTLGRHPVLSLAEARAAAREELQKVTRGIDPADERAARRERPATITAAVVDQFVERHAKPNNRTWQATRQLFQRDVLPRWGHRPIESIGRRDVLDLLDTVVDRGSPITANRLLASLSKLFSWCRERGILDASPTAGVRMPAEERSRDRVLHDDEIIRLWQAWERMAWPFGRLMQLALLTGQRRGELAGMRWEDLDLKRASWRLPREATKADRAHDIPLPALACQLIGELPRVDGEPLVFPARRAGSPNAISGFSRAKRRADQLSGVGGWTVHDLRRTAASGMARLGHPPHIVERILNHSSGTLRGVAGVYNRYGYLDEMRRALDAWGRHVEALVAPAAPAKVIAIR